MLHRLGVRQKLGLLITLPLAAVVCTIVPFTVTRVDAARAGGATEATATMARQTGWLIQDLQRERLLGVAYLDLTTVDKNELLRQYHAVDTEIAGRTGGPPAGLAALREQVLSRSVGPFTVYQVYHDAIDNLLDQTGLDEPSGVDPAGVVELANLGATQRADEAASQVGAALVIAAGGGPAAPGLLLAARIGAEPEQARLDRSSTPARRAALAAVVAGPVGLRMQALVDRWTGSTSRPGTAEAANALATAQSYLALRQSVEDGVAADIATESADRAARSRLAAIIVAGSAALILCLVSLLSVRVSRSVASPLRRLTRAATAIADLTGAELVRVADEDDIGDPPRLAAVDLRSEDEVGELAAAFNRVQATAALLLDRQVSMRRNVAVMFANIGRRTQSLVARQLAVIDDMERNEQDAVLLERLYRLDHLTTRLRRSADSLLVVAGTQDDSQSAPTPLVDVLRGAMAEIAGFQAIHLGPVPAVVIAPELGLDLRLLLAELLENATTFSPPGATVEVTARLGRDIELRIVDRGIGMTPARVAEENQRMVERQRLDLAPTQVLGLFVVGRLARPPGHDIRLDAADGPGLSVTVTVPARLFAATADPSGPMLGIATASAATVRAIATAPAMGSGWRDPAPSPEPPSMGRHARNSLEGAESFRWLPGSNRTNGTESTMDLSRPARPVIGVAPPAGARNGLTQRRPGHHFPSLTVPSSVQSSNGTRDPEAEAAQLNAFAQGSAAAAAELSRGAAPAAVSSYQPIRGGLTRRVPGGHLDESARTVPRQRTSASGPDRDSEAERDALNQYLAGLARAQRTTDHDPH